ncbi:MAG: DUF4352 domain-containing protein [Desulfurococcales archaeon]|nr:DUF4352 domain-containing protein [Desulfurococcales archaeon]
MKARKGISPVIATVIIVAVAIAISIAVAGWIMGLWGGFGQTESLKVFPDSYGDAANDQVVLIIQNTGGSTAQVYKVVVSNEEVATTFSVSPGQTVTQTITLGSTDIQPGVAYSVSIYTQAGNVYQTVVYGK